VHEVEHTLRDEEFVFALERHEALAKLLKIPWPYVCLGYGYVSQGELPDGLAAADLVKIG